MSVGFGFSVGDFIAAINLVGTVIDALSASSRSSSELQELLRQLHSLETALTRIKSLEFSDQQHAQLLALRQSAAQCQLTISTFLAKIASYQPHLLGIDGGGTSLKSSWKKIKWAVCKQQDVVQFKADLFAHTESIQLLLTIVQMQKVDLDHKDQQSLQRSIASCLQDGFFACMRKYSAITSQLESITTQAQECIKNTRHIISMNIKVSQIILDVQNLLNTIPGQIERQQPVYLNDALGRYTPFHLEFIRCPEALISVLAIGFRTIGHASERIERNQFTINDARTKRDIDLNRPWEACFRPGQYVEMSMVFDTYKDSNKACPGCRHPCDASAGEDVEWHVPLSALLSRALRTIIT
ncbi:MAG: hypothetical protein LQ350_008338 [Teloschistes chrysophthalmus]|nr:MAG: hypothetical protein LQ350_008338 [Niorma chrysophthalma]